VSYKVNQPAILFTAIYFFYLILFKSEISGENYITHDAVQIALITVEKSN